MRTSNRFASTVAMLAGFLPSLVIASAAQAQTVSLEVDQSQPLYFASPITGVVVGNAGIADVIVHDAKTLFVIGKSVGSTHVLAVDQRGRTVFSGNIAVRANDTQGLLTIQRGRETSVSLCDSRCVTMPHSESSLTSLAEAANRATSRTAFAAGGGPK